MGILLGVSFQTELLIMTLLGLANSTLDWKPFELNSRLNVIKELNFSDDNVQFSNIFSDRIRKLLTVTVVIEFFCGLLNPLTYLLKLYPIITWSRSNLLLPWLLTHALNTILPKMLSVSLVFVFYKANKISTLSLLEFVVVESINLSIASYNWYVFFAFYLNLREVERNRLLRSLSEEKIIEGPNSLSQSYSIPDLQEIFRETSQEPGVVRSARSLTYLIENDSQELDEDSSPNISFDENLSPAERSMKILNLTPEDLEDAKREKNITKESDSSVETHKAACSCSSSDDDDDTAFFISKKLQTRKDPPDSPEASPSIEIHSRPRTRVNPTNSLNRGTQIAKKNSLDAILNCQFGPYVLNRSHSNTHGVNDNLYFLLSKNIELLDKMCRTISNKNKNLPKDSMEKWLIFQHELECNLHRHVMPKESKRNMSFTSESSTKRHYESKFEKSKSHDSKFASFSVFDRMLTRNNTYAYRTEVTQNVNSRIRKTNVFKTFKNAEGTKAQELWNLKRYNDFTLEQDRKEMQEKNKKLKIKKEMKKQDERVECDVTKEEECQNLNLNYLEMRKLRSRAKEALKVEAKKVRNRENSKRFCAKDSPKKLNYQSQTNRTSIKDLIKQINWGLNLNILKHLPSIKPAAKQTETLKNESSSSSSEDDDRVDIFEDETLNELQIAFSHSDDENRGFHLGPETEQPYPIFQIVALTLTEILKASGIRSNNSEDELFRPSSDFPMTWCNDEEAILCGNEICATTTTTADVDDPPHASSSPPIESNDKWDEIERRKAESVSLVRQLEELLDNSRETLSVIETTTTRVEDPKDVLRHYYEKLQSDEIAQTIANWATESIDSMDSLDQYRPSFKANAKATVSFSDNSEMEEFPPN